VIGKVLKKYRVLEEVGQGGMAVVYRGIDEVLDREVAIKVLHPHLSSLPESKLRLQREAHAVAKLHHENILEIFDCSDKDEGESFLVTEFIRGQTLRSFLEKHKIALPEIAAMIVAEIAQALRHAHEHGIIHRDIKPENVMIRDDGVLKLMDFGIAQIIDKERLTQTGQLLGSPAYMAPEHVEGKTIDERTDLFAVGIVLYQLATAELPFKGKNAHEILKKIAECRFLDARVVNPGVGERLGRIIARTLARDPSARYQRAAALVDDLEAYLAEVSLSDYRRELGRYFGGPQAYVADLRPRLIATLMQRGRDAKAKGEGAVALELWNRVLTIDPDNKEVLGELDGIERKRRRLRVVLGSVALVGVTLGVVGGVKLLRRPNTTAQGPAIMVVTEAGAGAGGVKQPALGGGVTVPPVPLSMADAAVATAALPDVGVKVVVRPAGPVDAGVMHVAVVPPRPRIDASVRVAPTRQLTVTCFPKVFDVYIDGHKAGEAQAGQTTLTVDDEAHVVIARNSACCFDSTYELAPGTDAVTAHLSTMDWKPATLAITGPAGATIMVDGSSPQLLDATGHAVITVKIAESDQDRQKSVNLTLMPLKGPPTERTVTAIGGEQTVVTF
jgi:serine/threonine-protein kinase